MKKGNEATIEGIGVIKDRNYEKSEEKVANRGLLTIETMKKVKE
jgi:hypothetical protein